MKKKFLTEKEFLKILKNNSKENPFNIDEYNKKDIINNRCSSKSNMNFYIEFTCTDCNRIISKNINNRSKSNLSFISYCRTCLTKRTNLEKYGCEYVSQTKEVKEKKKKTNLKKYGKETNLQIDSVVKKCKKHNIDNKEQILEKRKQTNLEHFGCEYPAQNKDIYNKVKKTNLEKYGTDYTFQSKEIKEKIKETNLKKYGG